jgi:hypothetical protein
MAKEKKVWKTAKGEIVPAEVVSAHDKKKEKVVLKIAKQALTVSKLLVELKAITESDVNKLYNEHLRIKGIEPGERKENYTLYSFDREWKIEISRADTVTFDDNINVVKQLLDEYIEDVTNQASSDIQVLVQSAFKTRKGQLDKARLFSLFQYEIEHPLWKRAMEELKQSIDVQSSKKYIKIMRRDENEDYVLVPLSFSAV